MSSKVIRYYCFFLFLTSIIACENAEEVQPKDYSIPNAQSYIDNFNANKQQQDFAHLYTGQVYIRASNKNRLAIYVTFEGQQENLLFLLQQTNIENPYFEKSIERAQVFFFHNQLIINATTQDLKLHFALMEAEPLKMERQLELEYNQHFIGFGLQRLIGYPYFADQANSRSVGFGNPGNPPGPQAVNCNCNTLDTSDANCDSGGVAATSCSTSSGGDSCSVSCSNGFYACCQDN